MVRVNTLPSLASYPAPADSEVNPTTIPFKKPTLFSPVKASRGVAKVLRVSPLERGRPVVWKSSTAGPRDTLTRTSSTPVMPFVVTGDIRDYLYGSR